ncbi:hypothetical protein [Peribacillus muralis]|uniref:hypothetical protein n=1 Tax=Peribacillus muralis TaxID=264697 RepID=UPI003D07A785
MDPKTKAKLMEMVSEALDKQAHVSIHFSQFETEKFTPVYKEDVEGKAKEIAGMLSTDIKARETDVANSFTVDTNQFHFCFSYLPEEKKSEYMVDDVFLEEDAV